MEHFLVEVWVGEADHRWNTQTVSVMASSQAEATKIVAEDLGLPSGSWQGDDPPFELSTQPLEGTPWAEKHLPHHDGGRSLLAAVSERCKRLLGIPAGSGSREIRSPI